MKKRVAVIFGGKSSEHEVSIVSANSVIQALDKEKYDVVPVAITKEGGWLNAASSVELLSRGTTSESQELVVQSRSTEGKLVVEDGGETSAFDVVIPLIHGQYGEDGALQGFLELVGAPYVGCGVLGSAVGMDKVIQKQILIANGIPSVDYVEVRSHDWNQSNSDVLEQVESTLSYPMFTKPANAGSSVGVSKVKSRSELEVGINDALRYDTKVLVEVAVANAREIECAVLGNHEPRASVLGEIKPSNEFYDYDAKYVDGASTDEIPANISEDLANEMQDVAVKTFAALNGSGMARVDFLLNGETGEWFVNEVNTIPGFTSISMYPKLWEASGLPYSELLDELIRLAEERFVTQQQLEKGYQPSTDWHVQ